MSLDTFTSSAVVTVAAVAETLAAAAAAAEMLVAAAETLAVNAAAETLAAKAEAPAAAAAAGATVAPTKTSRSSEVLTGCFPKFPNPNLHSSNEALLFSARHFVTAEYASGLGYCWVHSGLQL